MSTSTEIAAKPYIHDYGARLSEGVTYLKESRSLFWVDIFLSEIHLVTNIDDPKATHKVVKISIDNYIGVYPFSSELPERVGAVFPLDSPEGVKEAFFGGKYGICRLSLLSCKWQYEVLYSSCSQVSGKDWARLRSNDGNVATNGDIYIGIMNDFHVGVDTEKEAEGCIFRVNVKQKSIDLVMDNVYIPNSINWNPADDTMYVTDSLAFKVWQLPYHNGNPRVSDKTQFIDFVPINKGFDSPEPDGSVIDSRDGFFYSAVFGSHKVQIFDTKGQLHRELLFPDTPNVTCCCIGAGGDLFVTTASLDVENGKSSGPGGSIYRVSADVVSGKGDVHSSKRNPEY
ncbi:LANO_0A03246g1_1 [Lachancea nothofagi CBS 11611]|uniref:LANO_0A03246g1_1 n=1 Tax=Lachancea nothofagi CBS 11611 TaxID=1266666 RepID=A0A1G4IPX7_9SACH|nr:LANO_0A03246g1_1 [Lachancea nothofagi CBS 11611]